MRAATRDKRASVRTRPLRRVAPLKSARMAVEADYSFMPRHVARAIAGQCRIGAAYYDYQI